MSAWTAAACGVFMRVYLDDVRPAPEGWTLARSYKEAIALLSQGNVTVISLDHDLGIIETGNVGEIVIGREDADTKTGYDVACWIEERAAAGKYTVLNLPEIVCHSANPVGRKRIEQAITSIKHRTRFAALIIAD